MKKSDKNELTVDEIKSINKYLNNVYRTLHRKIESKELEAVEKEIDDL